MMVDIYRIANLICSGVALLLTVMMALSYRKERRYQPLGILFSAGLSLLMLPAFVILTGARLNLFNSLALFLLGALLGILRGFTIKLYNRDDRVVGKYSMLSLLAWGGSYALAILLNSFDSALLASLGLVPLVFASGTHVSLNGFLFLRVLLLRSTRKQSV